MLEGIYRNKWSDSTEAGHETSVYRKYSLALLFKNQDEQWAGENWPVYLLQSPTYYDRSIEWKRYA